MGHGFSRHTHKNDTAAEFLAKHTFAEAVGGVTKMVVIPSTYDVAKALTVLNGTDTPEGRKPVLSAPVVLDA
jgi:hypothetical protein